MDPVTIANEATLIYDNITKNSNAVVTRILSLYDLTATKEALIVIHLVKPSLILRV